MRTVHYAVRIVTDLACGVEMFKKHKCPTCGAVRSGPSLPSTFRKRDVTCENCKRTKIFKQRKINCEPLSEYEKDIKFDL